MTNEMLIEMEHEMLIANNMHRYQQHGIARMVKDQIIAIVESPTSVSQVEAVTWPGSTEPPARRQPNAPLPQNPIPPAAPAAEPEATP